MPDKKEIIKEVLKERELEQPLSYVRRQISLPQAAGKALAVIGVRRAGKTTLLRQIWDQIRRECSVAAHHLLYLNFFDDRLLPFPASELQLLLEAQAEIYPARKASEPLYLFLDEIQLVDGWELFVSRMSRRRGTRVYLSGSSAKLLGREIATAMRGRALSVEVFPLSFAEFCAAHETPPDVHSPEGRAQLSRLRDLYLFQGGFPETVHCSASERRAILNEYYDVMLLRDVIERHRVRDAVELSRALKILMNQIAQPYTLSRLVQKLKSVGFKLDKKTMSDYLSWFEDCYLLYSVPVFAASETKRLANPRKLYCVDNGLVSAVSLSLSGNRGQLLENLVYLHLRRRTREIHYFRDTAQREVDFVADGFSGSPELIQVAESLQAEAVRTRELRALQSAMEWCGCRTATLVTFNEREEIKLAAGTVAVIPLLDLLLA